MSVGMGSQLFTKEILEKKDWPALEKSVRDILQTIHKLRT